MATVLAVVLALSTAACSSDAKSGEATTTSSTVQIGPAVPGTGDIAGVQTYTGLSRNHVKGAVKYAQSPPVGGDHDPRWQTCGVYREPIENEHAVHSLEHGAVWLTYQTSLPAGQVKTLEAFAVNQSHVLVSPYPSQASPVVATAWGVQLALDSASDPRLAQFVTKYQQGPQTPELGVTCSGGFGTPDA
jgi:hypothetical protein